ncbi:MAG: hypothetical protein ACOYMV_11535, partial [Verrucomicrobiia bacterium]
MKTHTLSAAEYLREVCFENRPSQADVEKLYPDLQDEIGKGGKRDARKSYGEIAKKMGVKAPYARTYGDVNRVGKDQGLGFFRRHSTAIATRPLVWANNNAAFL